MSQKQLEQVYDLTRLREISNKVERHKVFTSYYQRCVDEKLAPFLSDFLVEVGGWGSMPLEVIGLAEEERVKYGEPPLLFKIKVRCDQWGNAPKPGDKVLHKVPNTQWRKANPKDESYAKRIGKYDERYMHTIKYTVDDKGCIKCPFQSAVHFLNNYGLHSMSREPLTKKAELSNEPVLMKKGETAKKHVHYWRYEELTDEKYKALPKIKSQSQTEINK